MRNMFGLLAAALIALSAIPFDASATFFPVLPVANGGFPYGTNNSKIAVKNSRITIPPFAISHSLMASPPTVTTGSSSSFNGSGTGTISGTTLTIASGVTGVFQVGESCAGTSVTTGSVITAILSGSGGVGTYTLTKSSTVGSGETITCSSVLVPSTSGSNGYGSIAYVNDKFSYTGFSPSPGTNVLFGNNVTTTNAPAYHADSFGIHFYHDGAGFEIVSQNTNSGMQCLVKVNDEYVSATPNSAQYVYYNLGSVARRRIDLVCNVGGFIGINIGANDSLDAAPVRGPRVIFLGDSFTQGYYASGSASNNFAQVFADYMGWDDVWSSGVGGTGYVATNGGSAPTFGGRVVHDVIAVNPDIVWIVGSINDDGTTPSTVGSAAASLYSTLLSSLPNSVIIVSPTASGGVNEYSTNKLQVKAAMKAAATAAGVYWMDLLEYPLNGTPISGTFATSPSSGASSFQLGNSGAYVCPMVGATLDLDTGTANEERVQELSANLNSYSGGVSNCTITISGTLQHAHSSGAAYTQVGSSLWTGQGYSGAATGYGNSDLYVYTDGVHPVTAGHAAIGEAAAFWFMHTFYSN